MARINEDNDVALLIALSSSSSMSHTLFPDMLNESPSRKKVSIDRRGGRLVWRSDKVIDMSLVALSDRRKRTAAAAAAAASTTSAPNVTMLLIWYTVRKR